MFYIYFISATPNCSEINCANGSKNGMDIRCVSFFQISGFLIAEVYRTRFLVRFRLKNLD